MEYFLQRLARHLHDQYGDDLRDHCLVFPGRRSGLFFLRYLSSQIKKPVWAPETLTINELFRSLSSLHPAENEILLFELYKVYRSIGKTGENFNDFYFWGDILLGDFDDADKYLVDASLLFRNVSDLKKIDQLFGGLSDEQISLIRRFWTNFDPSRETAAKEKFSGIWSVLDKLYTGFRSSLERKNLAYEGMIFRSVAEDKELLSSKNLRWDMLHFIGFNALNECEKKLMLTLRENERARFYWDYDNSYIGGRGYNSAGFFLRKNLEIFGNDMPSDWSYDTLVSATGSSAERHVIETSSDIAQVKLIPALVGEIPGLNSENAHDTAVVLADENLLLPLLSSLPSGIPDINITMGYPLKLTTAYMLVKQLLDLQRNARQGEENILFYHEDVAAILKNELVAPGLTGDCKKITEEIFELNRVYVPSSRFAGSELLSRIFVRNTSPGELCDYLVNILTLVASVSQSNQTEGSFPNNVRNEFIYRIILAVNRLLPLTGSTEISMSVDTWTRLLDRILRMQSVPFSGEPLSGIQVMGILETRTLDFRNIIMLSVNEGIMPSATTASSFIPFSLREAFGLPSLNHRESVFAYHFYRLLHRAENVTFVYNSNPEGLRSGEMSRFIRQLKYTPALAPDFRNLSFEIYTPLSVGSVLERSAAHNELLTYRFSQEGSARSLSPSALNTWLNCRMKFFYRYVNGIREPGKVIQEIDPSSLGSMLHAAISSIYKGSVGKQLDPEAVSMMMRDRKTLDEIIRMSVDEVMKREMDSWAVVNELMVKEVLRSYIERILEIDRVSAPFTIVSLEAPFFFRFSDGEILSGGLLRVGGNIDRVDVAGGITRIVDYKTGKAAGKVKSIAALFEEDRDKDSDAWLQTLIYCEAYMAEVPGSEVRPSVYQLKKLPGPADSDMMIVGNEMLTDYMNVREEFSFHLKSLIKKIFCINEPFVMTKNRNKCSYCPYSVLCQR